MKFLEKKYLIAIPLLLSSFYAQSIFASENVPGQALNEDPSVDPYDIKWLEENLGLKGYEVSRVERFSDSFHIYFTWEGARLNFLKHLKK